MSDFDFRKAFCGKGHRLGTAAESIAAAAAPARPGSSGDLVVVEEGSGDEVVASQASSATTMEMAAPESTHSHRAKLLACQDVAASWRVTLPGDSPKMTELDDFLYMMCMMTTAPKISGADCVSAVEKFGQMKHYIFPEGTAPMKAKNTADDTDMLDLDVALQELSQVSPPKKRRISTKKPAADCQGLQRLRSGIFIE